MEFIYYIINFAILVGLILLVARKMIVNIFRSRREGIEAALDAAEAPAEPTLPEAEPATETVAERTMDEAEEARRSMESKIASLKTYTELECRELALEKLNKERRELLARFSKAVATHFEEPAYPALGKQRAARTLDEILSRLALTPGDMAYLRYHDVLYVTLFSAKPLPEELVQRAKTAAEALLASVGGRVSFWVREDPALIGGIRLRIGDTIYDATIAEEIYRVSKAMEKLQLTETDSCDTMLATFNRLVEVGKPTLSVYQVGRVVSASDGICWMDGLADIMYGEVIEFDNGDRGMVLDIQKDRIGCVIFGRYEHIESYSRVRRVGRIASVPAGDGLLGRVVDAIGNPIDGRGPIRHTEKRPIEFPAPGILDRSAVSRPLHTGIKAIDALVPIGKGQRELLVGDRQTGKTAIVLDTILNQKGKDVVCIYVGIGQKESTVSELREKLEVHGALDYTIIVSATASESAAMQYIAPFAGTAIGEYFMYAGRDVLIIYDDLSKHAVAYRELSLLLQRPSGREAYPGDIFYLHSRLLERSAQLSEALGGGSMTAMPIIETQAGDISSYIPTNVISITDGQIFLEGELFHAGQRPAVNVGLSVSRVGGAAQTKLMKQVAADLRTKLAQYRELAEFTQFGADVDEETRRTLNAGEHLTEALKQGCYAPLDDWKQALLLFTVSRGYADALPASRMQALEQTLYTRFAARCPELTELLKSGKKLTPEQMDTLGSAVSALIEEF